MLNSCRILKKNPSELKTVINGGGAAGLSICQLLLISGVKDIIVCDTKGAIYLDRKENMNKYKLEMAKMTNLEQKSGSLSEILVGRDFFIGVSAPK